MSLKKIKKKRVLRFFKLKRIEVREILEIKITSKNVEES